MTEIAKCQRREARAVRQKSQDEFLTFLIRSFPIQNAFVAPQGDGARIRIAANKEIHDNGFAVLNLLEARVFGKETGHHLAASSEGEPTADVKERNHTGVIQRLKKSWSSWGTAENSNPVSSAKYL